MSIKAITHIRRLRGGSQAQLMSADDGNHYVVLDYVSGEPLSRLVKEMKRRNLSMPAWVASVPAPR